MKAQFSYIPCIKVLYSHIHPDTQQMLRKLCLVVWMMRVKD